MKTKRELLVLFILTTVFTTTTTIVAVPKMQQRLAIAASISLPEATGYVVDTIQLLNSVTKSQIETICSNLEPIVQVAVCIVDTTAPLSLEEYSIKLAEKWKVGYKGKDNGIILLLARSDRKVRIEVGRGIEYKITDAEAGRILDNDVIPHFKQGRWSEGILSGIFAIEKRLK